MSQSVDIAAFVWPAYHDEPRWRRFMPAGIGEWETIRQAVPKFPGHYQPRVPLWGYTDEADPREMARKIDAAADHGVNVFIYDWYWYDNQPFLEEALSRGFLGAPNRDRMRFYLMWANHDATTLWDLQHADDYRVIWPGGVDRPTFEAATDHAMAFFRQPNYYTIDGKPVFCIYELGTLIDGLGGIDAARDALAGFRARARAAGFPGLHLQAILWGNIPATLPQVPGDRTPTQGQTIATLGIDSLTNYQWCHYVRPRGEYTTWAETAVAAWEGWAREFTVPFFPHVSIGWDTNPRFRSLKEDLITGNTPERFGRYLRRAIAHVKRHRLSPPLITVNSWNEWGEGSYLEPDVQDGMGYLDAVRDALKE